MTDFEADQTQLLSLLNQNQNEYSGGNGTTPIKLARRK